MQIAMALVLVCGIGAPSAEPLEVLPGAFIKLTSTAPVDAAVVWDVVQPVDLDYDDTCDGGRVFICGSGLVSTKIIVLELSIDFAAKKVTKTRHVIQVGEPPPPPDPPTVTFDAAPASISKGQSSTLTWSTTNADTVKRDGQSVPLNGTEVVTPKETKTYTVDAFRGSYKVTAQRIVTVSDLPPPPITEIGNRVLIIEKDSGKRSFELGTLLADPKIRAYLNAKCVKGPDGKTPEWRLFDERTDMKNSRPVWQNAMARTRTLDPQHPWVIISTGTAGFEGPIPLDANEALALFKKFFGE